MTAPPIHPDVESCVDATLARVGRRLVLGTPLGLGKPPQLINAFYRRAAADRRIELRIVTALSLARPTAAGELERRLVEPLAERLFGGVPELDYVAAQRRGALPPNVEVSEFYLRPGAYLDLPAAQQSYVSANYTYVVRDLLDDCINVVAQEVAVEEGAEGGPRYSLSSNPDLTLDLLARLRHHRSCGRPVAMLAQVNRRLPFMGGDAVVPAADLDGVVDAPDLEHPLFGLPNPPISTADYLIGLHASALVRDGGTLQVGIGSLGDAVVEMLRLRHCDNAAWNAALEASGAAGAFAGEIAALGGTGPFAAGLYGASEMFVHGFLALYRCGVLRRRAWPDARLQRLVDDGTIGEEVTAATLDALHTAGAVGDPLSAADVARLRRWGVLAAGVAWRDGHLVLPDGRTVAADLEDAAARAALAAGGLGRRLVGGRLLHAAFFLGPRSFYDELRTLPPAERELFAMTAISFVNRLYGDEELKRAQRRDARFLNEGMKVTLLGAAASDALEDQRVVSGVGGQYNFVAMAQELVDGRSLLMFPASRRSRGETVSNVVWRYGHTTIPRHLRDLVVTEYGVADLRGKTDAECVAAMLAVADSRFQEELAATARAAGKLPPDHRIPDRFRSNTPERLEAVLAPFRARGLFPRFPFGSDLTHEEVVLGEALSALAADAAGHRRSLLAPGPLARALRAPAAARPYLERMGLDRPRGLRERALRRTVLLALARHGAV